MDYSEVFSGIKAALETVADNTSLLVQAITALKISIDTGNNVLIDIHNALTPQNGTPSSIDSIAMNSTRKE